MTVTQLGFTISWLKPHHTSIVNTHFNIHFLSKLLNIRGIIRSIRCGYQTYKVNDLYIYKFNTFIIYNKNPLKQNDFNLLYKELRMVIYYNKVLRGLRGYLLRDRRAIFTSKLKPAHGQRSRGNAKTVRYANTFLNKFCTEAESLFYIKPTKTFKRYSKSLENRLLKKRTRKKILHASKKIKKRSEFLKKKSKVQNK